MAFSDLTDRLDEAVMTHLSDTSDARYVSSDGEQRTLTVILDRDVQRTVAGMQSTTMERRTELTVFSREAGDLARGEVITIGEQGWRLVSKDSDDGHVVTWIVKEER